MKKFKITLCFLFAVLISFAGIPVINAAVNDYTIGILGDVIGDDYVGIEDVTELQKHLAFLIELNDAQLLRADVDEDDDVTILDVTSIQKYLAKLDYGKHPIGEPLKPKVYDPTVPFRPVGPLYSPIEVEPGSFGDINSDGWVDALDCDSILYYITKFIDFDEYQLAAADIDGNGILNILDVTLLSLIVRYGYSEGSTEPRNKPVVFMQPRGDVNDDSWIDNEDLDIIRNYLDGIIELDGVQLIAADFNQDGNVTEEDFNSVSSYMGKTTKITAPKGDLNNDGLISSSDCDMIREHLDELSELDESQLKAADFNRDGIVTEHDYILLCRLIGYSPVKYDPTVPIRPVGPLYSPIEVEPGSFGDINNDGWINALDCDLIQYRLAELTGFDENQLAVADIDGNGLLNILDATLLSLIVRYGYSEGATEPRKEPIGIRQTRGDVNDDSWINNEDLDIIRNYLDGIIELDGVQLIAADFNQDGNVTEEDFSWISSYMGRTTKITAPKGDLNNDSLISSSDCDMIREHLDELSELDESQLKAADFNRDDIVTEHDYNLLCRLIGYSPEE